MITAWSAFGEAEDNFSLVVALDVDLGSIPLAPCHLDLAATAESPLLLQLQHQHQI